MVVCGTMFHACNLPLFPDRGALKRKNEKRAEWGTEAPKERRNFADFPLARSVLNESHASSAMGDGKHFLEVFNAIRCLRFFSGCLKNHENAHLIC